MSRMLLLLRWIWRWDDSNKNNLDYYFTNFKSLTANRMLKMVNYNAFFGSKSKAVLLGLAALVYSACATPNVQMKEKESSEPAYTTYTGDVVNEKGQPTGDKFSFEYRKTLSGGAKKTCFAHNASQLEKITFDWCIIFEWETLSDGTSRIKKIIRDFDGDGKVDAVTTSIYSTEGEPIKKVEDCFTCDGFNRGITTRILDKNGSEELTLRDYDRDGQDDEVFFGIDQSIGLKKVRH